MKNSKIVDSIYLEEMQVEFIAFAKKFMAFCTKNFLTLFVKINLILLPVLNGNVAAKQQQVLLDSNGEPLSNEVLLLLSASSEKIQQLSSSSQKNTQNTKNKGSKDKGSKKNTKNKKAKKKLPSINNPLLERKLLQYIKMGQTPKIIYLLNKGIRPTYKNDEGESPLGVAVVKGWASLVNKLIEHGADVHQKGISDLTLLHIASAHGLIDIVKILVENGLDPTARTKKDWTSLHIVARYGHWQLVQYFIEQGVDPNIRNSDGQTALGLAQHLHHAGIVKILSPITIRKSLTFKQNRRIKR